MVNTEGFQLQTSHTQCSYLLHTGGLHIKSSCGHHSETIYKIVARHNSVLKSDSKLKYYLSYF